MSSRDQCCPPEVQSRLLDILHWGLQNIRRCCENEHVDATVRQQVCWLEAHHLHNLPDLIERFSVEKLAYYLEIELVEYLSRLEAGAATGPSAQWTFLRVWLQQHRGDRMKQVVITGWRHGFHKVGVTKFLRQRLGYDLADAKDVVDAVLAGKETILLAPDNLAADLYKELEGMAAIVVLRDVPPTS